MIDDAVEKMAVVGGTGLTAVGVDGPPGIAGTARANGEAERMATPSPGLSRSSVNRSEHS